MFVYFWQIIGCFWGIVFFHFFLIFNTCSADSLIDDGFQPRNMDFPHGNGIVRENGLCSEDDNRCYSGLPFPSFNNYIDSSIKGDRYKGIADERQFLVGANVGLKGTNIAKYSNEINVDIGDIVLLRGFVHNNGQDKKISTVARNVSIGISDFIKGNPRYYFSIENSSIVVKMFIKSDNSIPVTISDTVVIKSRSGEKIKLMFYDENNAIQTTVIPKKINQSIFFNGGALIGDVKGEEPFYIYIYVRAIKG